MSSGQPLSAMRLGSGWGVYLRPARLVEIQMKNTTLRHLNGDDGHSNMQWGLLLENQASPLRSASWPAARHPEMVDKMVTGSIGSQCPGLASPTMSNSSFRETRELLLPSQSSSWDLRFGDHTGCWCNTTGDMVTGPRTSIKLSDRDTGKAEM